MQNMKLDGVFDGREKMQRQAWTRASGTMAGCNVYGYAAAAYTMGAQLLEKSWGFYSDPPPFHK